MMVREIPNVHLCHLCSRLHHKRQRQWRRGVLGKTSCEVLVPNRIYVVIDEMVNGVRARCNQGAVGGTEALERHSEQETQSVENLENMPIVDNSTTSA